MDVWELYDLEQDPHELNNVHGTEAYRGVREELHRQLETLQRELGDEVGAKLGPEAP